MDFVRGGYRLSCIDLEIPFKSPFIIQHTYTAELNISFFENSNVMSQSRDDRSL